jgi:hypothetical protein
MTQSKVKVNMRRHTPEKIEKLADGEVFVFGTNEDGFHGAGAAAAACMGWWKADREAFLRAFHSPEGDPSKIGKWAVLGVARGLMRGREGLSYGVVTIKRPGMKRSIPLAEIGYQLSSLFAFAASRPDLTFLVTKVGCNLAGFSEAEVAGEVANVARRQVIPDNVVLPMELDPRP